MIGPRNLFSQELHRVKYRQRGESFDDYCVRYARTTADDERHFRHLLQGLRTQAILPAGRQQRSVGWPFQTTAFNCFVGGVIPDNLRGIMDAVTDGAMTLRMGGGCGWDFSTIRGEREPVRGLGEGAYASGPLSFMGIWNAMCNAIMSAGERRGAMMAVLSVHHPDILAFVRAKQDQRSLTNFNVSVACSDEFMSAVKSDALYPLRFEGRTIGSMRALDVWSVIMEGTWDWAEPGVLFLDTANRMNPLYYCEVLSATNPCAEQWLPPNGACLLSHHNQVKYLTRTYKQPNGASYEMDYDQLRHDVDVNVRACDNVFEKTVYPLPAQQAEALAKRRMGIGVTGIANALEVCGYYYGSDGYLVEQGNILEAVCNQAYRTSIDMARVKGPFPLFDADGWLASGFAQTLPEDIRFGIRKYGLRNGVLLSIAPTGTTSMCADNVSSGIEPPPVIEQLRTVLMPDGVRSVALNDWAFEEHGIRCVTAMECSARDHIRVLCEAQKYVDNSISKTVNVRGAKTDVPEDGEMSFKEFKELYMMAYDGGAKGCATFNSNGKRAGIITERADGSSCEVDPATGAKTCG